MRRPFALAVALLALVLAIDPAAAQIAPPGTLPVTPDPTECGIAPREPEELIAAATPAATPAVGTPPASPVPAGEAADAATAAFVVAIVREAVACGNAHGFAGTAALLSDAALEGDALAVGAAVLGFAPGAPAPAADERRALLDVLEVRDLGGGRVGALVTVETASGTEASVTSVVLAEGVAGAGGSEQYLYLIDELVALPSDSAAVAATPVP